MGASLWHLSLLSMKICRLTHAEARSLAPRLVADGVDGIVVSGTTGESPTLTVDEKCRLIEEIRAEIGSSALLWSRQAGTTLRKRRTHRAI